MKPFSDGHHPSLLTLVRKMLQNFLRVLLPITFGVESKGQNLSFYSETDLLGGLG